MRTKRCVQILHFTKSKQKGDFQKSGRQGQNENDLGTPRSSPRPDAESSSQLQPWRLLEPESTSTTIWNVRFLFASYISPLLSSPIRFVSIFLDASTLPAELQRLLNTIRELDDRSQCKIKPSFSDLLTL